MNPTEWDTFKRPPSEWQCAITKDLPSGEWKFPFNIGSSDQDSSPKVNSKYTTTVDDKATRAESASPPTPDFKCECLYKRKRSTYKDVCPCKRDKKSSPSIPFQPKYTIANNLPSSERRSDENNFRAPLRSESDVRVKEELVNTSVMDCEQFKSTKEPLDCECSRSMQQTLPPEIETASPPVTLLPKTESSATNNPPDAEDICSCPITNNSSPNKRDRSFIRKPLKVKFDCPSKSFTDFNCPRMASPPVSDCEFPVTNNYSPEAVFDCTVDGECPLTTKPPDLRCECPIMKSISSGEWEFTLPSANSECPTTSKQSPAEYECSSAIQQYGYENSQPSENCDEPETWRRALFGIAAEVQRYFCTNTPKENNIAVDVKSSQCDEKNTAKENRKIQRKSKQEEVSNLKGDIRKACVLAKTIITAKEKNIKSLTNDRNDARKAAIELQEQINSHIEVIKRLSVENQVLSDKFENLTNFINLGYRELQKINGEIAEDVPVTIELRNIIVSCGKYYADYFNERQKYLRCSQKNIFLSNKIKALENLLQSNLSEVTEVRHKNCRLLNENRSLKNKIRSLLESNKNNKSDNHCYTQEALEESPLTTIQKDLIYIKDELSLLKLNFRNDQKRRRNNQVSDNIRETGDDSQERRSTVNTLFREQDFMLQELKKISRELLSESNVNYVKCSHKVNESSKVRFHHSIPKSINENMSIFGYPLALNNIVCRSSIQSIASSPLTSKVIRKEQDQLTQFPFIQTSNTIVLYKTDENIDKKSTLCGITSEMKEQIVGKVATKVEVFENVTEDKVITEKKIISSI